ncbi:MAG: hypothetical protein AAF499_19920 [Pseudomonadota bacterium]
MSDTTRVLRPAALVAVSLVLLHSCASPVSQPSEQQAPSAVFEPVSTDTAAEPVEDVEIDRPEPAVAERIPAAERLKAQAATAYRNGDFARALALLERAQRISPRDGSIYLDMASAHRADGRGALACQFARKGLSVPVSGEVADALEAQLDDC